MNWLAGLAIILLLVAAQESFLEVHRRRYGMWWSTRQRRFWADPAERSRMCSLSLIATRIRPSSAFGSLPWL
jgi:hypothetical protein